MKECLLLVDFQHEMIIPDCETMVEKMRNAVDVAKRNHVHCVNLLFVSDPESQLLQDCEQGNHDGSLQTDESSLLCEGDEVIKKYGYCMEDADARQLVERFDRIFLAGEYVEACELAVALQLYSLSKNCEIWWISDLSYGCVQSPYEVVKAGESVLGWNLFGNTVTFEHLKETSWLL